MLHAKKEKITGREKRARRVRRKVHGTADRPRLSVYRSLNNMYAQLVDDDNGKSIMGLNSVTLTEKPQGGKIAAAKVLGKAFAEKAREKGITGIVFDRNGYLYHGRIKAFAEGAREGGLNF